MFNLPVDLTVLLIDCCFEPLNWTLNENTSIFNYILTGIEEQQDRGGPGPRAKWLSPQFRRPVLALQPHQWLSVQPRRSQRPLESGLPAALSAAAPQIVLVSVRNTNMTSNLRKGSIKKVEILALLKKL